VTGRRVAVVGAGMTRFVRRAQETGKELAWEASKAALDSCELSLDDVDVVCCGTAPDAFDGVHMKGEYLSDGCGAVGKPFIRTYVGGGTGVFVGIQGWYTLASGAFDVALVVAEEKMSSTQPHPQGAFLTIFDNLMERELGPNLLWIFALEMNRYMNAYGLEKRDIAEVAVKNKRNAADHPSALLGQAEITVEDVLASETLAWPVQRLDVSPISDGAVALVLASEEAAKRITDKPVWIDGVGWNLDTTYWTNRDLVYPEYVENAARMAYDMAGIREPRKEIHVAEPYDPFDYKELHHLEGLQLFDKGKAPEAVRDGVTKRDGDLPVCPSGGLLGVGNPIAAAGLMKLAELFWQLRGQAGVRQVPGTPEKGVAQAWGDLMQVGTVVVMGRDKETSPQRASLPIVQTPPYTTAGHGLSDAEFRSDATAVDFAVDARYAWDPGIAIGRFLRSLKEGEIEGRKCSNCGRVLLPPRVFCERCFRETESEYEGPGSAAVGVVNTFSICFIRWDMQPLDPPEIPAVIDFPGTSGGFLHKLGEVEPEDVSIGMEVVAVWKPEEERTGSILDIEYFRPKRADEYAWSSSGSIEAPLTSLESAASVSSRMEGSVPIRHRYTAGVANKVFFAALRDRGVLLGSRCQNCGITYLPARMFCERCFSELSADVECGPGGVLESFTIGYVGVNGEPLEKPATLGLVKLDGADTVLMHRIIEGDQPLEIGSRVEAILDPERTGSILDLEGFRVDVP
jgi:acetyl-CoA C-acetyltransferase